MIIIDMLALGRVDADMPTAMIVGETFISQLVIGNEHRICGDNGFKPGFEYGAF